MTETLLLKRDSGTGAFQRIFQNSQENLLLKHLWCLLLIIKLISERLCLTLVIRQFCPNNIHWEKLNRNKLIKEVVNLDIGNSTLKLELELDSELILQMPLTINPKCR